MQINEIKRDNANKKSRQYGRGGKRGKTSGRGGKGQTARAGNKRRPAMRDIIKKLPKLRGRGVNVNKAFRENFIPVNLTDLNIFENDTVVSPQSLVAAGLVNMRFGRLPKVKILNTGKLDKKLKFENVTFSKSVEETLK
jgi:large subunit ribosomal protein L15